ncbi:MAG: hypothetical protein SYR96_14210, partial [Actinomycetota bacterium]|nr:hypothetical protein [Actinomycetota bacterium]
MDVLLTAAVDVPLVGVSLTAAEDLLPVALRPVPAVGVLPGGEPRGAVAAGMPRATTELTGLRPASAMVPRVPVGTGPRV